MGSKSLGSFWADGRVVHEGVDVVSFGLRISLGVGSLGERGDFWAQTGAWKIVEI